MRNLKELTVVTASSGHIINLQQRNVRLFSGIWSLHSNAYRYDRPITPGGSYPNYASKEFLNPSAEYAIVGLSEDNMGDCRLTLANKSVPGEFTNLNIPSALIASVTPIEQSRLIEPWLRAHKLQVLAICIALYFGILAALHWKL